MLRHVVRVAVTLFALFALGCTADPPKEEPQPVAPEVTQPQVMRLNIDVEGVTMADAMGQIARQTGKTIEVDPVVAKRTVTVSLRDIPWKDAVEVIARMVKARIEDRPNGVAVLPAKG